MRSTAVSEKRIGDTITQIKYKKDEVIVIFASGNKIALSPETFTDFHLFADKEIDEEELSTLLHASMMDRYYVYALKLLGKDVYSERQIQNKLFAKGADEDTVWAVTKKLKALGLIDDVLFAKTFASDIGSLRLYGKNKILYELRLRGISPSIIASLDFPEEEERDKAFRYASYLNRKFVKSPSEKKTFQVIRSLVARGFDESIAEAAVAECVSPTDQETEQKLLERYFELSKAKYSRKYTGYQLKEKIYLDLRKKGFASRAIKATIEKGVEL